MEQQINFRKEYSADSLVEENLETDPFIQFQIWFTDAVRKGITEPNVMVLSSVGNDMRPKSRMVLLKRFNNDGFTFFTNYNSSKAKQMEENPNVSLLFPWHELERQLRIDGTIQKVSEKESDEYFKERPPGSRIGAWTSPQSQIIPSRAYLDELEKEFNDTFMAKSLPRPPYWGGYKVIPRIFEFWQGRPNRLHDRIEYYHANGHWKTRRLAP